MRIILTFFFLSFLQLSNAQVRVQINFLKPANNPISDTIYYSTTQKLTWQNFTLIPNDTKREVAVTSSGFGFNAGIKTINGAGLLTVNVFCYFSKPQSWVKQGRQSDYALKHEQNHFNVSYINTVSFYKKLKTAKFTLANYSTLLNSIYDSCQYNLTTMQNQYDSETNNGINVTKQLLWDKKIDTLLKQSVIR